MISNPLKVKIDFSFRTPIIIMKVSISEMESNMNLSAAILIGQSTRMGRDKALLMLNGQTFVGRLAGYKY